MTLPPQPLCQSMPDLRKRRVSEKKQVMENKKKTYIQFNLHAKLSQILMAQSSQAELTSWHKQWGYLPTWNKKNISTPAKWCICHSSIRGWLTHHVHLRKSGLMFCLIKIIVLFYKQRELWDRFHNYLVHPGVGSWPKRASDSKPMLLPSSLCWHTAENRFFFNQRNCLLWFTT